ncbi:RDD family protein [Microbacterium sp. KUDC0406]|uniref:RDD family protein n=1 Tax=Microbacterium sp. KUDC0406 TaxID=2909588 RepID=UPI0022A763F2|nr:RDD family protein [Microbacterium sp. KUDC0406]
MTMLPFGQVAPVNRRVLAYVVDALIAAGLAIVLTIVVVVISMASGPDGFLTAYAIGLGIMSLLMLAWLLVYTAMQGGSGSIGMRTQGLRLARAGDGAPLGFGKALLRNLVFGVTAWVVVGYFSPLFDGSGRFQGWHDKAVGALMLDARVPAGTAAPVSAHPAPPAPTSAMPAPPAPVMPAPPAPVMPPAPTSAMPIPPRPPLPGTAVPAPPVPSAADAAGNADLDETVVSPSATVAPAPAQDPATPAPADALIAFVPGVTRDSAPEPPAQDAPVAQPADSRAAPAAPVRPEPEPAQPSEADEVEDTRISIPGHRLVFTWDDGSRVTVSRRTIFGRNPSPEDGAVVVPVRDETLSLSKTHFEAASEVSGGWVMDRHSTNGMTIVRDGVRIACAPGERTRVRLGDVIEIGDRVVTIGGYA